jgi:hypothetical protein
MKDFDKKVIMFVVGFSVGTFLMKKALNATNFNHPEPITIEHAQSIQNTQKFGQPQHFEHTSPTFSQFKDDKFSNQSTASTNNVSTPSYYTLNTPTTSSSSNKSSPYSSLMSAHSTDKKI